VISLELKSRDTMLSLILSSSSSSFSCSCARARVCACGALRQHVPDVIVCKSLVVTTSPVDVLCIVKEAGVVIEFNIELDETPSNHE